MERVKTICRLRSYRFGGRVPGSRVGIGLLNLLGVAKILRDIDVVLM